MRAPYDTRGPSARPIYTQFSVLSHTRSMEPVPTFTALSAVYDDESDASQRFERLTQAFTAQFGAPPELFVRSPGRVNLIGEHIDYEGYSVLPMAIALDTVVALRRTSTPLLRVANVQAKYPVSSFAADPALAVGAPAWANYLLCGYKGVHDHLGLTAPTGDGLELMVDGRVPTGSGLSSSSALVCASALAVMASKGLSFSKAQVAELACVCERYSGTQSGGMDQAISIMGQRGLAKVVHFNPVRTEDVVLPPGGAFVIANSLTVSNKAETAHTRYNLRVMECRLAAAALGMALGMGAQEALTLRTLRELEARTGGLQGAADAVAAHLHGGEYSREELEALLACPLSSMFADSPASLSVLKHLGARGFKLRDRAAHVFAEAGRVGAFAGACTGGAALQTLGALMDASHASCRDLYECSCPELEELVATAKARGALGARLTGAGWGGCAVMLVPEHAVQPFLADMTRLYFDKRVAAGLLAREELPSALFATRPGAGAAIFQLTA